MSDQVESRAAETDKLDRIEQRLIELQRVMDELIKEMNMIKTKVSSRTRRTANE